MHLKKYLRPKYLLAIAITGIAVAGVWYAQLSARHKAIVKTRLLHTLHIIDPSWEIRRESGTLHLESPDLLVDAIYQSMDGPQAVINLDINPDTTRIKWITGFKAEVIREGTKAHNNDFLCHTNIDYFNGVHYRNLELPKRINSQYPRLGTLSNGINELHFPPGFGFPVASHDKFIVASRTLNHNLPEAFFKVKHHIAFEFAGDSEHLKPLLPRALVLLQDFDRDDPYSTNPNKDPNLCLPIDLKNHSFPSETGVRFAAHWVLPKGEHRYEFDVTYQLGLEQDSRIHAMAAHLHPDAQSFTLFDLTENREVFTFYCENYDDKIGLRKVPVFSSEAGLPIYRDHKYALQLVTNNPSSGFRDMMAVLFLYLYDREMDAHLNAFSFVK